MTLTIIASARNGPVEESSGHAVDEVCRRVKALDFNPGKLSDHDWIDVTAGHGVFIGFNDLGEVTIGTSLDWEGRPCWGNCSDRLCAPLLGALEEGQSLDEIMRLMAGLPRTVY